MSKNAFTPDGGPHRPDRVRNVSDGLKRLGEFEAAEMLANYAALLRERESAKAAVTDEMVLTAIRAWDGVAPQLEYCHRFRAALEAVAPMLASAQQPIPMILHCPSCGVQHIDASDDTVSVHMDGRETVWDNPPHRSHLCHNCGTIWRPADVPTTGVEKIQTQGKNDVVMPAPVLTSAQVTDEMVSIAIHGYDSASPSFHPSNKAMRAALEAVAPMLASARVPDYMATGIVRPPAFSDEMVPDGMHGQLIVGPSPHCHIRLDFRGFNMARAAAGTASMEEDARIYQCIQAYLLAASPKPETEE